MLTFFEYLRQRAFESVMAGAYDALELLEAKKSLEEPKEKLPPPRMRGLPTKATPNGSNSTPDATPEPAEAPMAETEKRETEQAPVGQRKQSGVHNLKKKSKGPK